MDHRRARGDGRALPGPEGSEAPEAHGDRAANQGAPREGRAVREPAWKRAGLILPAGGILAEDFSRLLRFRRLVVGRDGSVSLLN